MKRTAYLIFTLAIILFGIVAYGIMRHSLATQNANQNTNTNSSNVTH